MHKQTKAEAAEGGTITSDFAGLFHSAYLGIRERMFNMTRDSPTPAEILNDMEQLERYIHDHRVQLYHKAKAEGYVK